VSSGIGWSGRCSFGGWRPVYGQHRVCRHSVLLLADAGPLGRLRVDPAPQDPQAAAGGAERGGGRAPFRGDGEPQAPGLADDGLRGRAPTSRSARAADGEPCGSSPLSSRCVRMPSMPGPHSHGHRTPRDPTQTSPPPSRPNATLSPKSGRCRLARKAFRTSGTPRAVPQLLADRPSTAHPGDLLVVPLVALATPPDTPAFPFSIACPRPPRAA
jgi:hypothetical protein